MTRRVNLAELTCELRTNCARFNKLILHEGRPATGEVDGVVDNLRAALAGLRESGLVEVNVRVALASAMMAELLGSF